MCGAGGTLESWVFSVSARAELRESGANVRRGLKKLDTRENGKKLERLPPILMIL